MTAELTPREKSHSVLPPAGPVLSAAERSRLQKVFEHGQQRMAKGEHDYAHDMLAACVTKDPGNLVYAEAMLDNLQRQYHNNKKGGRVKGNRGPFKKAVQAESWKEVMELGVELLKYNPWDVPTLRAMADACASLRYNEVELRYLKNALDANPKDMDVNRHCARSLARMGQFDQSIACWHRIEGLSANKSEAKEMISKLTMAKNKWAQGILDEQLMLDVAGRPSHLTAASHVPGGAQPTEAKGASEATDSAGVESSAKTLPENVAGRAAAERVRLERAVAASPTEIKNYLDLAHLLDHEGQLADAEKVLQRALAASGNDVRVQEQLEGVQVRRARQRLAVAQKQVALQPGEQAETLVAQLKEDLNRLELDIYERRSRRYPEDLTLHYELGVRLKRVRNYQAAAEAFEVAQGIGGREAIAQLNRGECLQQLHKYVEALGCYTDAISRAETTPARSEDGGDEVRKLALYRAGTLAAGLKDFVNAAKYLEKLISLDPGYRDAKGRLDKIRPSGNN